MYVFKEKSLLTARNKDFIHSFKTSKSLHECVKTKEHLTTLHRLCDPGNVFGYFPPHCGGLPLLPRSRWFLRWRGSTDWSDSLCLGTHSFVTVKNTNSQKSSQYLHIFDLYSNSLNLGTALQYMYQCLSCIWPFLYTLHTVHSKEFRAKNICLYYEIIRIFGGSIFIEFVNLTFSTYC